MADRAQIPQPNGSSNPPQPLRSALKSEDDPERAQGSCQGPSTSKVVQIVESPEPISNSNPLDTQLKRQYSANVAKRLSGRLTMTSPNSSRTSMSGHDPNSTAETPDDYSEQSLPHSLHRKQQYVSQKLLSQVSEWLDNERRKKDCREPHQLPSRRKHNKKDEAAGQQPSHSPRLRPRSDSVDSQSSDVALDKLQRILEDNMSALGLDTIPKLGPKLARRRSFSSRHKKSGSRSLLTRTVSSDTDYVDGDVVVPSCDAILDNTKTMNYNAGKSSDNVNATGKAEEKEAWDTFRNEIIRLAHTLRIKGWRRIPLDSGDRISVQRLSGALTNAVYVITPPSELEHIPGKKLPSKVLLRVYGPQAEHLIDRDNELSVLKRLARKKIGPRLLGTFTNGRFEEYFNSTTLTAANLREPETFKSIAKRMRELHDGIELLEEERSSGPAVWNSWDKWLDKVESRVLPLDEETRAKAAGTRKGPGMFQGQGFVCGTEWSVFRATVEKYRAYLYEVSGGAEGIKSELVFAHNDTQYGNILRVRPDDEKSPLLQPANEHKQLVVIDFEYSAANVPGYEFADHFIEWCYNYHDAANSHVPVTDRYPSVEEQRRFIKSYVNHRSQFSHASSTPRLTPLDTPTGGGSSTPGLPSMSSSSSIVDFMLDARVPAGQWREEERQREEKTDKIVAELMAETRRWRPACSAFWIAWGLVQANLPELGGDGSKEAGDAASVKEDMEEKKEEEEEEEEEDFDYLRYTQDRTLFFWGDCVLLGLVKAEELPEDVRNRLKLVDR